MIVEILFTGGCPHHQQTVDLVREVARDLGVNVELRELEVRDAEDAFRLQFLGSPTVRINGQDIETSRRRHTAYGMSCRLYGRSGTPSREMVAAALRERPTK